MPLIASARCGVMNSETVTRQPVSGFVSTNRSGPDKILADIGELILEQKTEKEMTEGDPDDHYASNTEFSLMNNRRQPVMNSVEESDFCLRALWGRLRPLSIRIMDLSGTDIIVARRSNNCCRCGLCCKRCNDESMTVEINDSLVGIVQHKRRWWKPSYPILDEYGALLYTVEGCRAPACRTCCRPLDVKFRITRDGTTVGEIKKHRRYFLPDIVFDRPYITITFPSDANIIEKALIICAAFYIEVHYWDEDPLTFMK